MVGVILGLGEWLWLGLGEGGGVCEGLGMGVVMQMGCVSAAYEGTAESNHQRIWICD